MRDFAWVSVKLFAPAAGAPGLCAWRLATAGVLAPGFAEGAAVWPKAPPETAAPIKTVMTAVAKSRFMNHVLNCLITHPDEQILGRVSSATSVITNVLCHAVIFDN